jgi:hypothetical protein
VHAGRWSPMHHAALSALAALSAKATSALHPASFSMPNLLAALDGIVSLADEVDACEPYLSCTESFESEGRTTLAIEIAAAKELMRLVVTSMPWAKSEFDEALDLIDSAPLRPYNPTLAVTQSSSGLNCLTG